MKPEHKKIFSRSQMGAYLIAGLIIVSQFHGFASADPYPTRSDLYLFTKQVINHGISVDSNSTQIIYAWDAMNASLVPINYSVHFRIYERNAIHNDQALPASITRTLTNASWSKIQNPSALLLDNGHILWLLKMNLIEGILETDGLFVVLTDLQGNAISHPELIRLATYGISMRRNTLVRLNQTAVAAFCIELNTLLFKISGDNGITWGGEQSIFEYQVKDFRAFPDNGNGSATLSFVFNDNATFPATSWELLLCEMNGSIDNVVGSSLFALGDTLQATVFYTIAEFKQDFYIFSEGTSIQLIKFNHEEDTLISNKYSIVDEYQNAFIEHLSNINDDVCICFIRYNDSYYYTLLNYWDSWLNPPRQLTPTEYLLIAILVIAGGQVGAYVFYRNYKKKQERKETRGSNARNTDGGDQDPERKMEA